MSSYGEEDLVDYDEEEVQETEQLVISTAETEDDESPPMAYDPTYASDTCSYTETPSGLDAVGSAGLITKNIASLVPELNIDAAFALYDGWLKNTPFLPAHLQRIFDVEGMEWKLQNAYLHKQKESKRLNELLTQVEKVEGISRRCVVHFLGDINPVKFTVHTGIHLVCVSNFISVPRTKYERELILLALLLHAYLREARQDPTSQICRDWEEHTRDLPF